MSQCASTLGCSSNHERSGRWWGFSLELFTPVANLVTPRGSSTCCFTNPQTLKTTTFEPTAKSFRWHRDVSCCDRRLYESLRFGQGEGGEYNWSLFPRSTSEPREFYPLDLPLNYTRKSSEHILEVTLWNGGEVPGSSLLVVHSCTLRRLRLRIIRVIHSRDFAVPGDTDRGLYCNLSIFPGFAL